MAVVLLATGCGSAGKNPVTRATQTLSPTVVFIGDSITELWAAGSGEAEFAKHPTWISKGISGQTSNQLLARFEADVVDLHPDIVHILVGTNDVYPGWALGPCDVPAGSSNYIDSPANIRAMVRMAKLANIKVIVATIPPWETDPITVGDIAYAADSSPGRYALIAAWNGWLKEYAAQNNLGFVDYHSVLEASDLQHYVTALTMDGVHPSAQGYSLMTPLAEAAVKAVLALPESGSPDVRVE